jgi:cardiolipin synthase
MHVSGKDRFELINSGLEYFDRLNQLIESAEKTIHLQVYIFDEDETGTRVADSIIKTALRGVKVYITADGYASQGLSGLFIQKMRSAGVFFRYFNPLVKSRYFYLGRRMHHKALVVDGMRALVGGINISDNYNDTAKGSAWLDWALYVEGPTAFNLEKFCLDVRKFEIFGLKRLTPNRIIKINQQILVRVNDWVRGKREVTTSYLSMLLNAGVQVTIVSSYLLPGAIIRKYLQLAARRGVTVRLVMGGMSDVAIAKHAERYLYRWLLRNGIEIYEYQKNILHGKLAVCDGELVTLGSYNVNNISAYASMELNLLIHNPEFANEVELMVDNIISTDCKKITWETYQSQDTLWNKFLQRSAYDIFRIVLFLFTFYFKKQE